MKNILRSLRRHNVGIENIVKIAVTFLVVASLTGQLPRITNEIRRAQIALLQNSMASKWGSPDLTYSSMRKRVPLKQGPQQIIR